MPASSMTLCAIFRIPPGGLAAFLAYEDAVLRLLAEHGGVLTQRLRSGDSATEIHVIRFQSAAHLDAYRADPRRLARAPEFARSGATAETMLMDDFTAPD